MSLKPLIGESDPSSVSVPLSKTVSLTCAKWK